MEQLKNEESILTEAFTAISGNQKKASQNLQSKPSAKATGRNSKR